MAQASEIGHGALQSAESRCAGGTWLGLCFGWQKVMGGTSGVFFFFFFTLVTGPRRSLSLKLSDTRDYEPQIRARLGTTTHFCEVVESDGGDLGSLRDLAQLLPPQRPAHHTQVMVQESHTGYGSGEPLRIGRT